MNQCVDSSFNYFIYFATQFVLFFWTFLISLLFFWNIAYFYLFGPQTIIWIKPSEKFKGEFSLWWNIWNMSKGPTKTQDLTKIF